MAHLFVKDEKGLWSVLRLESARVEWRGATFERTSEGEWLILASGPTAARVNGMPLAAGLRALSDRDEIRLGASPPLYFSTERLPSVVPFPEGEKTFLCQRCKQPIQKDASAVQCPNCRVWHHQSEELPCWTYSETCAVCDNPTALDAEFRWTPEEL